ncbi:hypothetical protein GN956_G6425 [Arapaima gigas]
MYRGLKLSQGTTEGKPEEAFKQHRDGGSASHGGSPDSTLVQERDTVPLRLTVVRLLSRDAKKQEYGCGQTQS